MVLKLRPALPVDERNSISSGFHPSMASISMREDLPIDVTPYLGRAWDDKTWNCYSLVQAIYLEVLGITLPDYSSIHPDDGGKIALAFMKEREQWRPVCGLPEVQQRIPIGCPGDVALFRIALPKEIRKHENHIGVVVEPGRFLHVRRETGTTAPSLNDPSWRPRLVALYRHPSLVAPR